MRTTLFVQAQKAQYQWHKHVPLMKFLGPRKNIWKNKKATEEPSAVSGSSASSSSKSLKQDGINFWELPARYRPLPISEAEMEAIESGGASLI
ncbi:hypothetical protein LPJ64_001673 [Coemansia asiatica]|uniref:Uncharacterized protein n=1 Tax=Coemansia asiatica TaxID=1052880 RepID=A0A9W7XKZ5_9FUNG|nr:hypothetical protein LPJ64_001673 [Coemansia asiatica]